MIVLDGNLHAEIAPLSIGCPEFETMAVRLRGYGTVLSLGMQHAGGETWGCQLRPGTKLALGQEVSSDMIRCAAFPAGPEGASDGPPQIKVGGIADHRLAGRFDGTFRLGDVTA